MNSFIVYSAFYPGPPNCDPMDSEKRLYTSQAPGWHTTRGMLTSLPTTHRIGIRLKSPPMGKIVACIHGLRCELVKNAWPFFNFYYECMTKQFLFLQ